MVHIGIKRNKEVMNIITVYNSVQDKEIRSEILETIKNYGNESMIIGRDFNIRIGELGEEEEKERMMRKSKDKKIGNRERRFVDLMTEKGINF